MYWDGSGAEPESFDAWGKRRLADATDGTPGNLGALTGPRGFTGHEHLDTHGLIHMNGRMYEPSMGRFLNADPVVQAPLDAQSWNRYSYVMNNPLGYTDPTGYSWWTKWRRPIAAIVVAYFTGYFDWGSALGGSSSFGAFGAGSAFGTSAANFGNAVASGFAAGGIQGGNLESAVQGAFSASLFFGVGELTQGVAMAGKVAAHAAAGCASGAAAGGSCRSGAMAAGFAELAGPPIQELAGTSVAANIAGRAVVGAVGSKLGGGSYENGAVTAAFGYLFNCLLHECLAQGRDAERTFTDYLRTNADPSLQLGFNRWYDSQDNFFWGRPDIYSEGLRMVWDVKPDSRYGWGSGAAQVGRYTANGVYSAGTGLPLFGSLSSVTLTGSMNRYDFRYGGDGLVIYRALDASPMERSLGRAFQNQAAPTLSGPMWRRSGVFN